MNGKIIKLAEQIILTNCNLHKWFTFATTTQS